MPDDEFSLTPPTPTRTFFFFCIMQQAPTEVEVQVGVTASTRQQKQAVFTLKNHGELDGNPKHEIRVSDESSSITSISHQPVPPICTAATHRTEWWTFRHHLERTVKCRRSASRVQVFAVDCTLPFYIWVRFLLTRSLQISSKEVTSGDRDQPASTLARSTEQQSGKPSNGDINL